MAKPEKTFRLGPVNASIFLNDSQSGPFHTIQVQRRYKDDQSGEWRSSDSFTAQQAASVLVVLQQAVAYVLENGTDDDGNDSKDASATDRTGPKSAKQSGRK